MKISNNKTILGGLLVLLLGTSCCWLPALIIAFGGAASLMAISTKLENFSGLFILTGILSIAYGIYQYRSKKQEKEMILQSVITCPFCNHEKNEIMPVDACQYFYECESCKKVLKPITGDCCVYCSYGTVACPPIQEGNNCC